MKPARTHTQGVSLLPSPNLLFSEYKTKRGLRGRGAERLLLFFHSLLSFFCLSENQGNKRKGTKKKRKKTKKNLQAPTVFQFHNMEILHPPPIFIPAMECPVALAMAAVAVAVIIDSISKREFPRNFFFLCYMMISSLVFIYYLF